LFVLVQGLGPPVFLVGPAVTICTEADEVFGTVVLSLAPGDDVGPLERHIRAADGTAVSTFDENLP
jgi:hypothetical protein